MFGFCFAILCLLKVACGEEGLSSSWIKSDAFFIKGESLAESARGEMVASSSFVECCVKCEVSRSCNGVACKEGECSFINDTSAVSDFVTSDGSEGDYKVAMFYAEAGEQVGLYLK